MAETDSTSRHLKAFDANQPTGGGDPFDYDAFLRDASSIATETRDVRDPGIPSKEIDKTLASIQAGAAGGGTYTSDTATAKAETRIESMIEGYKAQQAAVKGQAEKAATALETKGAAVTEQMKSLYTTGTAAEARYTEGVALWSQAAGKAKDYVKQGYERLSEITGKLESIFETMNTDRDFAKAHAMNAGVQSTLGSIEGQGREIAREFGVDSKEYQQFVANKGVALGQIQSNIQASWQQMKESGTTAFMTAYGTAAVDLATHVSYKEQQHVDTIAQQARYTQEYAMQNAQLQTAIAQMRGTVMDDWANWIIGTPEFNMDISPFLATLAEMMPESVAGGAATATGPTNFIERNVAFESQLGANRSRQLNIGYV